MSQDVKNAKPISPIDNPKRITFTPTKFQKALEKSSISI